MQSENQQFPITVAPIYPVLFHPNQANQSQNTWLNSQLNELVFLQFEINQQLFVNRMLTDSYLQLAEERVEKNNSSEGSTTQGSFEMRANSLHSQEKELKASFKREKKIAVKKAKRKEESDYEPCQDSYQKQPYGEYRLSQSKNAPKNFGNSILTFIAKNKEYVQKVLDYTGKDYESFSIFINRYKNKINTISQLRFLWIDSNPNPYAKPLRIISESFLKKYSLGHIFNSRVSNHGRHVKYRQKILKQIKKPQQFTQMKDF